jgi:hypothetical protein
LCSCGASAAKRVSKSPPSSRARTLTHFYARAHALERKRAHARIRRHTKTRTHARSRVSARAREPLNPTGSRPTIASLSVRIGRAGAAAPANCALGATARGRA